MDADLARRKRIIYRSKQRGWLEVDLLLGNFATANVMSMTAEQLTQYEDILAQETINISIMCLVRMQYLPKLTHL